jgi:hypothetical protein
MRTRTFALALSVISLAAAGVLQACGGDSSSNDAPVDAGRDVADTGRPDTGPLEEEDAATCDLSADLTKQIVDASIADGASTMGICVGCAKAKCGEPIDDCNKNCQCQELTAAALDCYGRTGNVLACAGPFAGAGVSKETQQTAFELIGCIQSSCKEECATEEFNPQDAGPDGDAADGDASDAAGNN